MGLDQRIMIAKNKKATESKTFWDNLLDYSNLDEDSEFTYDKNAIVFYQRKNWGLHKLIWDKHKDEMQELTIGTNKTRTDNGVIVQLSQEDMENILSYLTHNRDYFDGFHSVPSFCEVLSHYQEVRNNGFQFFYEGDY